MKLPAAHACLLAAALCQSTVAFLPSPLRKHFPFLGSRDAPSRLYVSIGLGPGEEKQQLEKQQDADDYVPVAGVDYEIPKHEEYRLSRRSKIDEECDEWFNSLLSSSSDGILGDLVQQTRERLATPVPLVNDVQKSSRDDPEWTPYVSARLPWTPLVPAYGLEVFGLPVPRRNAETWRHFDVSSMVQQDYSRASMDDTYVTSLTDEQKFDYTAKLKDAGAWLEDDACTARLVYIDGHFCADLSKTSDGHAYNIDSMDNVSDQDKALLARLTDGFTDELAVPVPCNDLMLTSFQKLSGPDHNLGEATSQFAINTQQGTACFAALNTIKTRAVAYVRAVAAAKESSNDEETPPPPPVVIINAITKSAGVVSSSQDNNENKKGVALHPRTLVIAEAGSRLAVVQTTVDLDNGSTTHTAKLHNGYTQVFVHSKANVTHSYLEESGGLVTMGTEKLDEEFGADETPARVIESQRSELKDTFLEAIDVHIMGEKGSYEGTIMSMGGSGRVRISISVTLLSCGAHAAVNGFSLAGGAQRSDMKTNIHHIAQGTTSRQMQKNMIGGRATGSFRGRIRVEQSAQQTDSQQLSRTILLSEKSRAWSVPSLEIVADDVQCTHGATVSDLSEEELFYLRSRGLDPSTARNLLMYAFADDVANCVDKSMLGSVDSKAGLQKRIIQRLQNLVPQKERSIKGEFQSI
jgi:SUF system FeS cluster assembly, SufBD